MNLTSNAAVPDGITGEDKALTAFLNEQIAAILSPHHDPRPDCPRCGCQDIATHRMSHCATGPRPYYPAAQTQDVATLSRDTTNTNGTVSNTPNVSNLLSQQADTMQAAQAAGQVVAQSIGAYADAQRQSAVSQAKIDAANGNWTAYATDVADASQWDEGWTARGCCSYRDSQLVEFRRTEPA
jgi:hypothetical protein